MIIETQRLILREYNENDLDDLYEMLSSPITMKHYPKPYDMQGSIRWLNWCMDSYKKNGFGLWAVILKETNTFIGDCGLSMQCINSTWLPEIGYHIKHQYWRNGYGKEAAEAVKNWAFKNTKFESLYSYMNKENVASYKTAMSIGMKKVDEYQDDDEYLYVYKIDKNA